MVAVTADELLEVARHDLLEILTLDNAGRRVPLVEAFVPDDEAHLVTEIQELWVADVVRGADGVHAHVLHQLQLTPHRCPVEGHAQGTEV